MARQRFAVLIFLLISTPLYAQWWDFQSPSVPRDTDGKPDLSAPIPKLADGHPDTSGMWVPVQAHGSLFDSENIKPWALEKMAEQEASFYRNDPRFHCLPSGPGSYPAGISVGGMRRMVHHPDFIAILNGEMTFRQVYMDGRELPEVLLPSWMGYSIGYWDGDTLVIESNGYNDKTWLTREGLPHTEQLHIIERYRRLDFGHMELEIIYEDSGTFKKPVQAVIDLVSRPDSQMLESICNEASKGRSHWNGEIDQAEQKVVEVSEETLKKYVGTYQGIWLGSVVTAEILIEDGDMFLVRTPRYSDTGGNTNSAKSRLIAQSETAFDCACGLGFVFKLDASGEVTGVSEVHVSGEWIFDRVK